MYPHYTAKKIKLFSFNQNIHMHAVSPKRRWIPTAYYSSGAHSVTAAHAQSAPAHVSKAPVLVHRAKKPPDPQRAPQRSALRNEDPAPGPTAEQQEALQDHQHRWRPACCRPPAPRAGQSTGPGSRWSKTGLPKDCCQSKTDIQPHPFAFYGPFQLPCGHCFSPGAQTTLGWSWRSGPVQDWSCAGNKQTLWVFFLVILAHISFFTV